MIINNKVTGALSNVSPRTNPNSLILNASSQNNTKLCSKRRSKA